MASNGHRFHEEYDASYESTAMAIASQIMVAAVVILFTAVLFILGLHIYAHYFCRRSRLSFRGRRLVFVSEQDPPRLQSIGLAKSAIEALPVFVYQTENHKDGLECAVCLCEFVENENARLLPKCRHSFHIDCIDMWFFSHSTCPLCRASAQPDTPADSVVVQVVDEQAASGSASETDQQPVLLRPISVGNASTSMEPDLDIEIDLCHSCRHQEVLPSPTYPTGMLFWATQKRVSSESNSDVFDQETTSSSCKTLEQISIEIPRRVDSFSSPKLFSSDDQQPFSPSGQTLKSPGIRLRSLKRLLSKDMKVVPQSPDAGRNIHIEQEGLLIVES